MFKKKQKQEPKKELDIISIERLTVKGDTPPSETELVGNGPSYAELYERLQAIENMIDGGKLVVLPF